MICNQFMDCNALIKKCFTEKETFACPQHNTDCIKKYGCDSRVVCSENKKKYELVNIEKNLVTVFHMDGGISCPDSAEDDGIKKCDYYYVINYEKSEIVTDGILIELKGTAICTALKQLLNTVSLFKKEFSKNKHTYARIVMRSSVPNIRATSDYLKLNSEIQELHGNIKIKENILSEKDIELKLTK